MLISSLKSKLHNAVVTISDINYEGSISIDDDWIKQAGLNEYEKVLVVNKNNGERFETYVIKAPAGSKEIGINGAAARLGEGTHQFATLLMFFRRTVREIETDNVHPAFNHLVQNFRVRTRRTQSGDNFCSTQHGLS